MGGGDRIFFQFPGSTCPSGFYASSACSVTADTICSPITSCSARVEAELSGGNDGAATNLQACRGECDADAQCATGLACYQRSHGEAIPGCHGDGGGTDWDYCYNPRPMTAAVCPAAPRLDQGASRTVHNPDHGLHDGGGNGNEQPITIWTGGEWVVPCTGPADCRFTAFYGRQYLCTSRASGGWGVGHPVGDAGPFRVGCGGVDPLAATVVAMWAPITAGGVCYAAYFDCARCYATAPPAEQHEVRAPTATSDRICVPTTACGTAVGGELDEYEVVAPTATTNRVCATVDAVTECSPGEYELSPPTPTTARRCEGVRSACVSGVEYEGTAPTATSDRRCAGCAIIECCDRAVTVL